MARDTQRSRVYDAETAWRESRDRTGWADSPERVFVDVDEAAEFIRGLLEHPAVRLLAPSIRADSVRVRQSRANAESSWVTRRSDGTNTISLMPPHGALTGLKVDTAVHEVTHIAVAAVHQRGYAAHGWQFAQMRVALTAIVYGEPAADLLVDMYRAHRVKSVPPTPRASRTPAQLAAARARTAAARSAMAEKRSAAPGFRWRRTKRPGSPGVENDTDFRHGRGTRCWYSIRPDRDAGTDIVCIEHVFPMGIGDIRLAAKRETERVSRSHPNVAFTASIRGGSRNHPVTEVWVGVWVI